MNVPSQYELLGKVTKLDLAKALLDRSPLKVIVKEDEYYTYRRTIEVLINSITAENGSGESWILDGFVSTTAFFSNKKFSGDTKVHIYCRTDRSEGYVRLSPVY